jgi:hypothetical protein
MSAVRTLCHLLLVVAGLCTRGSAQLAPETELDPRAVHADRLCIKLAEGSGAELVAGHLRSRTGHDLSRIADWFARGRAEPLITALGWDELAALQQRAAASLPPERRPAHLGLWFRLHTAGGAASLALRDALAREPLVAYVYLEPRFHPATASTRAAALPGDIPPTTPSFVALQQAHALPPTGHAIRFAAGVQGGRGRAVTLAMIESTWLFAHEDTSGIAAANFLGAVPTFDPATGYHGLAGFSIAAADRNGYGITGVADEVTPRFVSFELNGGLENAMLMAMSATQPGDVLLIVLMVLVPTLGPGTWLPVEFFQSVFDTMQTVTAAGRHVVIPAGNGDRSLDDPSLLNRFDRNWRDSGATIVAASDGGALQRAAFSNWGSRVDLHSWGNGVVACGYGQLFWPGGDDRQAYTDAATGTSSATPHAAGLTAAIVGAAKRQLGITLLPAQLRALLQTHGVTTPDAIGPRTDLRLVLQAIGVLDGLQVAAPDVPLGGTLTVDLDGPPGSVAALFGAFATGDVPLGFNRNVHLDLATMANVGAFFLPAGQASWQLAVPLSSSLQGANLYFQAVRLFGSTPLHVTNSCQVTIL